MTQHHRNVSKRLITVPERHASTVHAIAQRVVERWPKVEQVAAAMSAPTLRASSSRDGGRSSGHPDPVAGIALDTEHAKYDELRDAVAAWLEQGKWIEQRQIGYLKEHPDVAASKREDLKGLCTEPGCDFAAVRRAKCWHHYEAELEAERAADQDHHTATTRVIASAASSSPVTLATISCMNCGRDIGVPDGTDPVVFHLEHRDTCTG